MLGHSVWVKLGFAKKKQFQLNCSDYLWVYKLSNMWYGWIALFISIIVAVLVSWATGFAKAGDYDPNLIYSVTDNCCPCCPDSCITCFRCGHEPAEDADWDEVKDFINHTELKEYTCLV